MPAELISSGSGVPHGKTHLPAAAVNGAICPSRKAPSADSQRSGGENIEHAGGGKTPIAPSQEACIIRLEARPAQNTILLRVAMQQQHTPVPQSRSFALLGGKMAVNVCAARLCEYPGKWLDDNLDRIKRTDLNRLG